MSVAPSWNRAREVADDPLLEVGTVADNGRRRFGELSSVAFVSGGRIAAGDSPANRIHVFDSVGRHLVALGRSDEGPGELRGLGRIYPYPGDSVAAFDFGLSRILVFPLDGGLAREVSGLYMEERAPVLGVLSSGSFISYQHLPSTPAEARVAWDSLRVILVTSDGARTRTIGRLPSAEAPAKPGSPRPALAARSVMAASTRGFYWARSDRYEIMHFDSLGAIRQVIRRPVEPKPLTEADRATYHAASVAGARAAGGEQAARAAMQQLIDAGFARSRPLFGSAFVDRDERLWISEVPWPSRYAVPRRWSVFDAQGRWLGDVEVPERFRLGDASGDLLLGIWRDEHGVPSVRLYRVRS